MGIKFATSLYKNKFFYRAGGLVAFGLFFFCAAAAPAAAVTWTPADITGPIPKVWSEVTISADGTTMLAAGTRTGESAPARRLYRSRDGGDTWAEVQPAGDASIAWSKPTLSADGDIMFVGVSGVSGGRLYRSEDGGDTWAEVQPAGNSNHVWELLQVSDDGEVVLAGVSSGRLYRSEDGGDTWAEVQPAGNADKSWFRADLDEDGQTILAGVSSGRLYRSEDGGDTWAEVQPSGGALNALWYPSISAGGDTVFVSGNNVAYLSTDSGDTWDVITPPDSLTVSRTAISDDGGVVLAVTSEDGSTQNILRSEDGGDTWDQISNAAFGSSFAVAMDGTGEVDAIGSTGAAEFLYISTDGGATHAIAQIDASAVHATYSSGAISRDGTTLLFSVREGGSYMSTDSGATWHVFDAVGNLFQRGTGFSISANGDSMAGSFADASGEAPFYISANGGSTWTESNPAINTKEVYASAMSGDGQTILASSLHDLDASAGRLYLSINGGDTWTETQPAGDSDTLWYDLVMSTDGQTMLAGGEPGHGIGIYLSTDGGDTWTEVNPTEDAALGWYPPAVSGNGKVILMNGIFFVGDDVATILYLSTDSGATWQTIDPSPGNLWTNAAISNSGQTIVVLGSRVYLSTDGGDTWTETQPAGDVSASWSLAFLSSDASVMAVAASSNRVFMGTAAAEAGGGDDDGDDDEDGGGAGEDTPAPQQNNNQGGGVIGGPLGIGFINMAPQFPTVTAPTSGITEPQIQSIVGLLQSFGADAATIANVTAALRGQSASPSPSFTFTRDLQIGSLGEDVRQLQKLLNAKGFTVAVSGPGSLGNETTLFGTATRAALIKFQQANDITPVAGYFGPKTQAVLHW